MDWYQALFDYGQAGRDGGAAPPADDDADNELIPRLVRGGLLPLASVRFSPPLCQQEGVLQGMRVCPLLASVGLMASPCQQGKALRSCGGTALHERAAGRVGQVPADAGTRVQRLRALLHGRGAGRAGHRRPPRQSAGARNRWRASISRPAVARASDCARPGPEHGRSHSSCARQRDGAVATGVQHERRRARGALLGVVVRELDHRQVHVPVVLPVVHVARAPAAAGDWTGTVILLAVRMF